MTNLSEDQRQNISEIESPHMREMITLYYRLSTTMMEYFSSETTAETMNSIWVRHDLDDDQAFGAAKTVGFVLLGKVSIKDFVNELKSATQLAPEQSKSLAQDINEQIFQPVRDELLLVHGISENGVQQSVAPAEPKLEIRSEEPHTESPPVAHATPAPAQQEDAEASRKREELLARLRAGQSEPPIAPVQERPEAPAPPKAVTTAWNGKTIDLSKIPPRREVGGNGKKNGEGKEKIVKLKKGPDGYWYEV